MSPKPECPHEGVEGGTLSSPGTGEETESGRGGAQAGKEQVQTASAAPAGATQKQLQLLALLTRPGDARAAGPRDTRGLEWGSRALGGLLWGLPSAFWNSPL